MPSEAIQLSANLYIAKSLQQLQQKNLQRMMGQLPIPIPSTATEKSSQLSLICNENINKSSLTANPSTSLDFIPEDPSPSQSTATEKSSQRALKSSPTANPSTSLDPIPEDPSPSEPAKLLSSQLSLICNENINKSSLIANLSISLDLIPEDPSPSEPAKLLEALEICRNNAQDPEKAQQLAVVAQEVFKGDPSPSAPANDNDNENFLRWIWALLAAAIATVLAACDSIRNESFICGQQSLDDTRKSASERKHGALLSAGIGMAFDLMGASLAAGSVGSSFKFHSDFNKKVDAEARERKKIAGTEEHSLGNEKPGTPKKPGTPNAESELPSPQASTLKAEDAQEAVQKTEQQGKVEADDRARKSAEANKVDEDRSDRNKNVENAEKAEDRQQDTKKEALEKLEQRPTPPPDHRTELMKAAAQTCTPLGNAIGTTAAASDNEKATNDEAAASMDKIKSDLNKGYTDADTQLVQQMISTQQSVVSSYLQTTRLVTAK